MTPGIPRLRLPDFSFNVSPTQPSRSGTLCTIALGMNVTRLNICSLLSVRFAEVHLIIDKEFASYYEEQDDSCKDISE